jgi:hypothetical protein
VLFLIISEEQFSKKEFVIILLLILALFTLKINYSFLALLLLFIPKEKISFQKRLFLIFFTIFAFLLLVIGWNFLVLPNFDYSTQGINSFAQLTYIFSHPFIFIKILFQAILSNLKDLFQGWIGSYAYGIGIVPPIVYPLYLIGIVFLALFQYKERITTLALRITLVLLALCNVLFIFIVFYLTHTSVGETTISPVQGRYLFLAGLFFLMGICGFIKSKFTWVVRSFSSLLIIISLGLYSFGLFATYYVKCGSNLYMPGLCYLPFYQDWRLGVNSTGNLKEKYIVQQSFISQCKTIKEVSIKLAPNSENQGEIFFHFYDSNTNSLLASDVMEITNVVGEKLHFPIDVTNAEGKQFYFTLEGSQSTDSSPSFAITHDDNLEKMVLNGQIQNSNLIFQYGCSVK